MTSSRVPRLALALTFLALPVHADVLTVGPAGSGAAFDSISAAVSAAADGDTVLVQAGEFTESTAITIDRPLRVVGAGSARTTLTRLAGVTTLQPHFEVRDLAAGEVVEVSGFTLQSAGAGPTGLAVRVEDNAGLVSLGDLVTTSAPILLFGDVGLSDVVIARSQQVLIDGCALEGSDSLNAVSPAGSAVEVEDSTVFVNRCVLRGGSVPDLEIGIGNGLPGAGVEATGSLVRIARSSLFGGDGHDGEPLFAAAGGPGASGLRLSDSTATLRGGDDARCVGGEGGSGAGTGVGGAAVFVDPTSFVSFTPDLELVGGFDGGGLIQADAIVGTGATLALSTELATLATVPSSPEVGEDFELRLSGAPGGFATTLLSFAPVASYPLGGVIGVGAIAPGATSVLGSSTLDGLGDAVQELAVPNVPALAGLVVYFQSLVAAPNGELSASGPTWIAVAGA